MTHPQDVEERISMEIQIRKLVPSDYDDIIALWKRAGLSHRPLGRDSRGAISAQMDQSPELFLGAYDGDSLIGVVIGSDDGRKGWINRLAVDPSYRRQGVATRLVAEIEENLRSRGRKIICTLVEDWNESSIDFFKECGYIRHDDISYLSKRESPEI